MAKQLYKNRRGDILTFGDAIAEIPAREVRWRFADLSFGDLLLPYDYNFGGIDLYGGPSPDIYMRDQTPTQAWVRGFKWKYNDGGRAYCLELHISYRPGPVSETISCAFQKETQAITLSTGAFNFNFAETGYEGDFVNYQQLTPDQVEEYAEFLEGILKK